MSEELDIPPPRIIRLMGMDLRRSSVEKALYSATAFLVVFNAFSIPFALPKLKRFLGAPFLPSNRHVFRTVLDNLPEIVKNTGRNTASPLSKFVDIGSGDGRLVAEAAKHGYTSLGIEMNPWLAFISKLRLIGKSNTSIRWANAWNCESDLVQFQPDVVMFYGRPGQGVMSKFGELVESVSDKTGRDIFVISNKFAIPNWHLRQIAQVGDFIVYKLHSNGTGE